MLTCPIAFFRRNSLAGQANASSCPSLRACTPMKGQRANRQWKIAGRWEISWRDGARASPCVVPPRTRARCASPAVGPTTPFPSPPECPHLQPPSRRLSTIPSTWLRRQVRREVCHSLCDTRKLTPLRDWLEKPLSPIVAGLERQGFRAAKLLKQKVVCACQGD